MKNFGNRLGFVNNEVISDARQVLSAKRNNGSYNSNKNSNFGYTKKNVGNTNKNSGNYTDARAMISNRQQNPNFVKNSNYTNNFNRGQDNNRNQNANRGKNDAVIDFTIPKKTVKNNLYMQDNFQSQNFMANKPSNPNSRISLSTNKFSGKNFCDPNASQGIFSTYLNAPISQKPPFANKSSESAPPNNSLKRSSFGTNEPVEPKRKREASVENLKFTVVNTQTVTENKKPALSTAKFAQKANTTVNSLVSPIQGYRIEVKNLHPQVNVDDVYELFTSLKGELRSCNLVRPGYAEVVFRKLVDAEKSIEEFHGRELDGKPMNLKLVTPAFESVSHDSSTSEIKGKINKIQTNRKPAHIMQINKEAVFRSMYAKSMDSSKLNKKPFKFSVTL